mgnify:CR=1 FL=1
MLGYLFEGFSGVHLFQRCALCILILRHIEHIGFSHPDFLRTMAKCSLNT